MKESEKTNLLRDSKFHEKFFKGRGIDIGSGPSLVVGNAEPFDLTDGDANLIIRHREEDSYDFVHSSHCLEHMENPKNSLPMWWQLLKRGGYLILVVPDEDLYEQGIWPSIFNSDHKWTFTLKPVTWSPKSLNILDLANSLPGARIISADIQDRGYDYSLRKTFGKKITMCKQCMRLSYLLSKIPMVGPLLCKISQKMFYLFDVPADQTLGVALAQIQIVIQKEY